MSEPSRAATPPRKPELVCPAGSLRALTLAVDAGADAVYMGLKDATNARNFAGLNFDAAQAREGVAYAHRRGAKVLMALNTYAEARDPTPWWRAVDQAASMGADALICGDVAVMAYAREHHPNLRLHLSVQASATTYDAIEFYRQRYGIQRAVLPRVLTLSQVGHLRRHSDVEIEVFGFGSLCVMGSNMQCQAVPLVNPESPIVGTGMEGVISEGMQRVIRARHAGTVEYVDGEKVVVKLDKKEAEDEVKGIDVELTEGGKKEIYYLVKFKRTAHSTCYNQMARVSPGQKVAQGDLLVDGPASEDGELGLGRNLVIAYTSFGGYGFEDAILISQRLVKEDLLTSIHIEEYEAEVVDTKLGPEEITNDIPNVSEAELANLAGDGIVMIGAEVGPNDILVGKIAPKGETELTSEERLLRAIFGEKAREVRDTSLRIPHGERGIVVDVQILDRDKGDELGPGVIMKVIVRVAQIRKINVGDKVAGRHGNKGVVSKILPVSDMPYMADGTPVDILISPLSVISRMNLGQLMEAHLGWALKTKNEKGALPVFDRIGADVIAEELKQAGLPVTGKTRLYDGRTGEAFKEDTVVGISYIMKLIHMVEDKTHARSTGPYSLVTQQPLGGKAQMGGQRLGEMEVWALESHRASHTLQEMLTIKSDDVLGRAKAFEAIVKGVEIPEATIPESFKVLVRELNSLGLAVEPRGAVVAKVDEEIVADEGTELAKAAGSEVVATEELTADKGPMEVVEVTQ